MSIFRTTQPLHGRDTTIVPPNAHYVHGRPLQGPFPPNLQRVLFGMGCFWGAERLLWETPGVYTTAVGYAGGTTRNPSYEDVCTGRTGHAEVVLAVFDPHALPFDALLRIFWEAHDPTQGMRQGPDVGTQYRSAIYTYDAEQQEIALDSRKQYQMSLTRAGLGAITTEIAPAGPFYYAETYHQQYLAKNPHGYCSMAGTGVSCPLPHSTRLL